MVAVLIYVLESDTPRVVFFYLPREANPSIPVMWMPPTFLL